jgi:MFS family permease
MIEIQKPQEARFKFAAMLGVYFFGSFNDNFFRQTVLMLAVAVGLSRLQGYIMFLFALPFILFACYSGFLADRFSKRSVIIASRLLAVFAFIIGTVGLFLLNWPIIIATVFLVGLQAAIMSPSIFGTIPELYPPDYIIAANGIVNVAANAAILLGIASAGPVRDVAGLAGRLPLNLVLAASLMIVIALFALIVSFFVPKFPPASSNAKFPWRGPWESLITLYSTRRDKLLAVSILANAFFWFAGSLQILIINPLGLSQFHLSATLTSALVIIELVGIAIGSLLAPILAKGPRWFRVLAPSILIMAASMFAVALVPFLPDFTRKTVVIGSLALLGMAGGVYSVPLAGFIQAEPAPELKGRMIAASNFANFTGILLSGPVFYLFERIGIRPSNCFALEGIIVVVAGVWLMFVLPKGSKND